MKKFGTPICAGLGSARLNEGLVGVGTPFGIRGGWDCVLEECEEDEEDPPLELDEPEPEPEDEDEPGCEPPLPEEDGPGCEWPLPGCLGGGDECVGGGEDLVVGGGVLVVVGGGFGFVVVGVEIFGQVSAMLFTPGGRFSVDGETPGGSRK